MTSFFELTIVKKANLLEEYDCFTGRGVESLLSVWWMQNCFNEFLMTISNSGTSSFQNKKNKQYICAQTYEERKILLEFSVLPLCTRPVLYLI